MRRRKNRLPVEGFISSLRGSPKGTGALDVMMAVRKQESEPREAIASVKARLQKAGRLNPKGVGT